uniref:PEHE domain-containing protein n=1 Tax=Anopheles farauti TaxID=69004 RepID=A0A182QH00_9DIPT
MGASSASAINMMDTMDDHVYCNSTTASPVAPVTSVASPNQVTTSTTTTATTTVAEIVKASEPCDPAHFQQSSSSSPSQYSPSPSSPHPSSPQPSASPRPSSPIPLSSGPGSPAPSSPVPFLEDDTLMMDDDGAEAEAAYEREVNEPEQVQQDPATESEAEAELCVNDVYEYRVPEGDSIDPGEMEYGDDEEDDQEGNENGGDDDDERNDASDSGVLSDDQQGGDDPNDGNSQLDGMAAALEAMKEVKQLRSILLLHLDLIQEQGDQILSKDKMIIRLKDEKEVLKHQLDLANRRVSLMMLQLQQNGLALPSDHLHQQQHHHLHHHNFLLQQTHDLPPVVKQEGTVSPLTIRNQLENGRMRPVVLKSSSSSSSSPPFVSSSVADGVALYGLPGCLPIRNPEVSSTVSPVKEELPDDIVLQNDALSSSPYYNDDDDDDGDADEENEEEEGDEDEDGDEEDDGDGDDEGGEDYRTDNNEEEEEEEEDEEDEEEEEMGYEDAQDGDVEDGAIMHTYANDDPGNVIGYDDTPMVMIDEGAVEVKMETNSPASQQEDSQEGSQDSLQQAQSLDVHVPFVESTSLGSEGEPQEEEEEEPRLEEARSSEPATMEYEPCSESTEESVETRRGPGHQVLRGGGRTAPPASHPFNPVLHCPSGNSSDCSSSMATGSKRHSRTNPAYMVTQKEYISCAWKDDAVAAELEKLLTNEAAELEIPSWTVIEDDADDEAVAAPDDTDAVSASECATVRENISDEAYAKRHMKLEIDERRRKKWDVQRIREQKNIERLKKRQLKEQPVEQEAQKTITTLYPTVETLKYIQVTEEVPVQAFGELIPVLPRCHGYGFSLPWHQTKAGPSFANPAPGVLLQPHHHHLLSVETKTKFLHRLAPSLQQAQKQRFTKRLKKEL